ncbi:MAG: hypothetical protein IT377_27800 [Polyangiaceae bacterium]|nr:hypothetical protein [Polyangiaceae bacterium]
MTPIDTVQQAVDALKSDDPNTAAQLLEDLLTVSAEIDAVKKAIDALEADDVDTAESILSELAGVPNDTHAEAARRAAYEYRGRR